jgi:hypothetical protein
MEVPMLTRVFTEHPASVGESYGAHFLFALRFSLALFAAAGAALVHALVPCLFQKTASRIVAKLYARTHNRGA